MNKDFDNWNGLKKRLDSSERRISFKERDVLWCNYGLNIGYEQNGKGKSFMRPVLVIKKFNSKVFLGVPFSTKIKENNKFYHQFEFKGNMQSVILNQLKLMDAIRLSHKFGAVNEPDFDEIIRKLKEIIF